MFKSFEWSYHTDRHQYYNDFSTRNDLYAAIYLNQIKNRSAQSKNDGMGAIAGYDMRVHTERDPLPALQKIGEGAFNGTVTRSGSAYTKDWTAGAGTMITYADVQ